MKWYRVGWATEFCGLLLAGGGKASHPVEHRQPLACFKALEAKVGREGLKHGAASLDAPVLSLIMANIALIPGANPLTSAAYQLILSVFKPCRLKI